MIRIWITPTDLGVLGYVQDVPGVESIHRTKSGDLILHNSEGEDIGRCAAGRWDTFVLLDDPPVKKAVAKKPPAKKTTPRRNT